MQVNINILLKLPNLCDCVHVPIRYVSVKIIHLCPQMRRKILKFWVVYGVALVIFPPTSFPPFLFVGELFEAFASELHQYEHQAHQFFPFFPFYSHNASTQLKNMSHFNEYTISTTHNHKVLMWIIKILDAFLLYALHSNIVATVYIETVTKLLIHIMYGVQELASSPGS